MRIDARGKSVEESRKDIAQEEWRRLKRGSAWMWSKGTVAACRGGNYDEKKAY